MVLPIAHLGHWYVGGPIFLAPVLVLILWIKVAGWRERRARARGETLLPEGSRLLIAYQPLLPPLRREDGAPVDVEDVPLGRDTRRALAGWAEDLDELTDFGAHQVPVDSDGRRLDRDGIRLWERVRAELGAAYTVGYESPGLGRAWWDPAEADG